MTGDSLIWGFILISVVVVTSSTLMVNLAHPFIEDERHDKHLREWLFSNFGSSAKAGWTLFECTLTGGGWLLVSRKMIDEINGGYALFWIAYVILVNFALTRVVGSMFLKQAMSAASADAEKVALERMKKHELFAGKLRKIFEAMDSDGSGCIGVMEFREICRNEDVQKDFEHLDLTMDEVAILFKILSHEDGNADYHEFLSGCLKMKSNARALNVIQILHQIAEVEKMVSSIVSRFGAPPK